MLEADLLSATSNMTRNAIKRTRVIIASPDFETGTESGRVGPCLTFTYFERRMRLFKIPYMVNGSSQPLSLIRQLLRQLLPVATPTPTMLEYKKCADMLPVLVRIASYPRIQDDMRYVPCYPPNLGVSNAVCLTAFLRMTTNLWPLLYVSS